MPRYKLAIFDLDGTLSDSFPWFLSVVNDAADRHGFRRIADSEIDKLRGLTSREIIKSLGVPLWKLPAIGNDMRKRKAAALRDIPLFPGTGAMLRGLRDAGVTVALVTSDNETNAKTALREHAAMISHYACGASLFGKAAKFKRVMTAAGVAPHEAIAIGDEVRDADAARDAGIAFGAVSWGYATVDALRGAGAARVFASMEEVVGEVGGAKLSA
jgi:phosphoglycolate phosphatase